MAEDQVGVRKDHPREGFLWTKIFSAFKVALDPKKLLLAAMGIVVMALGWWLLAVIFYQTRSKPNPSDYETRYAKEDLTEAQKKERADADYQEAKRRYDFLKYMAGPGGTLRTMPWYENRGPNPFRVVEDAILTREPPTVERHQLMVLVEPLVKFLSPVVYLFHPGARGWNTIYLLLVILWTLITWGFFGGAITRMAVVQAARNEKIGMTEALRFTRSRYLSFLFAPLFPLILLAVLAVLLILYGAFEQLTWAVGDILVAGLLWPVVILFGLVMAVVLVGLVGWPLMYSTISAEGSDSFDALSRSYSYVYQAPWHYLWYSFLAVVYGAVLVFFVGLMGSLTVYLGKWAVSASPVGRWVDREPDYLFVYAPTSFGWRQLLLDGSPYAYTRSDTLKVGDPDYIQRIETGLRDEQKPDTIEDEVAKDNAEAERQNRPKPYLVNQKVSDIPKDTLEEIRDGNFHPGYAKGQYLESLHWYNKIGAFLVSLWVGLILLLVIGFGYSYFWSASTIIYLLMRRNVDDTELDEVHLEEDEAEEPYAPPSTAPAGAPPAKPDATPGLIPSESLTLRSSTPPAPTEAPPQPAPEPPPAPVVEAPAPPVTTPPPEGPGGNRPGEPPGAP
jgi:hypothetical protein